MQPPLFRLQCEVAGYHWGLLGKSSSVARFASATGLEIEEDKRYAELWMGTHPSFPAKVLETQQTLLDLVKENKALLTPKITQKFGEQLPFLFKVLSIGEALSIQAHPNKKLAEQLHAQDSKNYSDDNHKPEMTIAITPFEGLCGFRPLAEIAHFLKHIEPLRNLIGSAAADEYIEAVKGHETDSTDSQIEKNKQALKSVFSALMDNATSSSDDLAKASDALIDEAKSKGADFAAGGGPGPNDGKELADLLLRQNEAYPRDVGLFVLFFLNYVKLDPGESMYLKADDIHAYLSGELMECMANSNNVVRAGFTPKFKDVKTLTSMLTYSYAPISEQKMQPVDYPYVTLNTTAYSSNSNSTLYDPPIPEFSVVKTLLKVERAKATFEPIEGPSIVICTGGRGTITVGNKSENLKEGFVYFVGANAELVLESESEDFLTFKAFCEIEEAPPTTNGGSNGHL